MGMDRWQAVVCRNGNMSLLQKIPCQLGQNVTSKPVRVALALRASRSQGAGSARRHLQATAGSPPRGQGFCSACVGRLPRPNSAAWARPPGDPTLAQPWARQTAREMTARQSNHWPRVHARSLHPEWHRRSEARCVPLACPLGKPMRLTECAEPDRFG